MGPVLPVAAASILRAESASERFIDSQAVAMALKSPPWLWSSTFKDLHM